MIKKYSVVWDIRVQKQDLRKIATKEVQRIIKKVESVLSHDPYQGNSLKGEFKGLYRYRVGDYRIIYDIQESQVTVRVVRVRHRKDAYDN